jgi:hypothetical protein
MSTSENFYHQLRSFVLSPEDIIPARDIELVLRLVDHNEGGKRWFFSRAIVEDDIHLPRAVINQIHEMADGLIDPRELPADLDAQATPQSPTTPSRF